VPTKSSSVVVVDEQGRVLLVLREDARIWALPAGICEPDESYERAAVREVREETGYEVELDRIVGEYWRPQMPLGGDQMRVYVGHVTGGDPSTHDWESLDVRWFALDALPSSLFGFSREHIQDALANATAPFRKQQRFSWMGALLLACFLAYRRVRNRIRGRLRRAT
jgi:8-oxo-dGTP pyrophosphatase MutT (NUDIX family)